MDIIRKAKLWARLTTPTGPLPDGDLDEVFGTPHYTVVFDANGRVWQVDNYTMKGGHFVPIRNGRTATLELLDKLDVQDWPELPDEITPR